MISRGAPRVSASPYSRRRAPARGGGSPAPGPARCVASTACDLGENICECGISSATSSSCRPLSRSACVRRKRDSRTNGSSSGRAVPSARRKPDAGLVVAGHERVRIPDPLHVAGTARTDGDRELAFEQARGLVLGPPRRPVDPLVAHHARLFDEHRPVRESRQDGVPACASLFHQVCMQVKSTLLPKNSGFGRSLKPPSSWPTVTSCSGSHCSGARRSSAGPTREHVLREPLVVGGLSGAAGAEQVAVVKSSSEGSDMPSSGARAPRAQRRAAGSPRLRRSGSAATVPTPRSPTRRRSAASSRAADAALNDGSLIRSQTTSFVADSVAQWRRETPAARRPPAGRGTGSLAHDSGRNAKKVKMTGMSCVRA